MKTQIKEIYFYQDSKKECNITFVDSSNKYFDISIPINRVDLINIIREIREGVHPDLEQIDSGMKVFHKKPSFAYKLLSNKPETLVDLYLKHKRVCNNEHPI